MGIFLIHQRTGTCATGRVSNQRRCQQLLNAYQERWSIKFYTGEINLKLIHHVDLQKLETHIIRLTSFQSILQ